jgi:hypothetical protein
MILTKQVENEAILSNVGATTDFKIKATAKSFRILADGLYANKIRAIVREVSCNAYDSHVAAGKPDLPFDVHLPNSLEPYFSIRDYGVGLSDDEVTNIFTTFFESTKTGSNDFVGALGLGSKSPFSYTDNFTVTAVKAGVKGVYTAFINDHGVPSIALMFQEATTDPNGVEIRFAVENERDFRSFCDEAQYVYRAFKHKPVVSGNSSYKHLSFDYETENVVPGVHVLGNRNHSGSSSFAIMGNIAYPIQVPDSDKTLGELSNLLQCGLLLEFAIGELDFQASREGLSYIPQTVNAIKQKLEALNAELVVYVTREAEAIANTWERAYFLYKKYQTRLWSQAVLQYVQQSGFDGFKPMNSRMYLDTRSFSHTPEDLKSVYNIEIKAFIMDRSYSVGMRAKEHTARSEYQPDTSSYRNVWQIGMSDRTRFVIQDTTKGCVERAKYHYREHGKEYQTVYVLTPADSALAMKTDEFFQALMNPPETQIQKVSELSEKPKVSRATGQRVQIMMLERRGNGARTVRDDLVWRPAKKLDEYDVAATYYYLPLSGFESLGKVKDTKRLVDQLQATGFIESGHSTVFGVRKDDLAQVQALPNWVNLDEHVMAELAKLDNNFLLGMVKSAIDWSSIYKYNVFKLVKADSPYMKLYTEFKDVEKVHNDKRSAVEWLCKQYEVTIAGNVNVQEAVDEYKQEATEMVSRYPLLDSLSYYAKEPAVADYINMCDQFINNQKGE